MQLEVTGCQCSLGPFFFSSCRMEDAAAQEMSPKRLVRTMFRATSYTLRDSSTASSDAGVNLTLNV